MGVSRTTAMLVYEELIAQGYLETKPAAGTFVSARPPGVSPDPRFATSTQTRRATDRSSRGTAGSAGLAAKAAFDFRSGGFDHRLFPVKTWQRLVSRALRDGSADRADDHPAGSDRLRTAVAAWMAGERGIATQPEEVIIVSGIRQASYILARLLLGGAMSALVDTPLPRSAAWAFDSIGAKTVPLPAPAPRVPAGHEGARLAWLNAPHPHAAPEVGRRWWKRRAALLEWARQTGAYLVEYEGVDHILFLAPPAGAGFDDRVIRLGDFSPTLSLGTRMGYMVVPAPLVESATSLKELLGDAPPWLEQVTLARFIEDGAYSRHLRRVGKVMMERREALIGGLRGLIETATTHEPTAEDHVDWSFPAHFAKAGTIRDRARAEGIALDIFEHGASAENTDPECGLCLGYARMNEHQIAAGLRRLAAVIDGVGAT